MFGRINIMSKIYKYYKHRLIEISGKNRSLYSKKITNKFSYDLGMLFRDDYKTIDDFVDFLWAGVRPNYQIIGKDDKDLIYKNLNVESKLQKYKMTYQAQDGTEKIDNFKLDRVSKQELKRTMMHEVLSLKNLKRELEEFERETGRYELYVGYPFVEGFIGKDLEVRAPLVLFPVTIDIENETTADIEIRQNAQIKLNKVLLFAYASYKKLNVDEMETDFDDMKQGGFKTVADIITYLSKFGFDLRYSKTKNLLSFESAKDSHFGDPLTIKNYCVLGRFPLTNSIYNDYEVLEKKQLTTEAIDELLLAKQPKQKKKFDNSIYAISELDYAQQKTIENLNKNSNMVIYGPPGTGKSQTIVNIITDAIVKNKKVLVISQKRAALEVVYNRLANLNSKAMMISDSDKSKMEFYLKAKKSHDLSMAIPVTVSTEKYNVLQNQIDLEVDKLKTISDVLFQKLPYGLTLQQMYSSSEILGKKSNDYVIFQSMQKNDELMKLNFAELHDAVELIKQKKKDDLYYKFIEKKQVNPLIDYIKTDIDMHTLNEAQSLIKKVLGSRFVPFDMTKRPYARDLLSYYLEHSKDGKLNYKPLTKFIASTEHPKLYGQLKISHIILPLYPVVKPKTKKIEDDIEKSFDKTLNDLKQYIADYQILENVLVPKGYLLTCDNILSGNTMYLKLLSNALSDYVEVRDINFALLELTDAEKLILKFAYKNSDNYKSFKYIVDRIVSFRTYGEVIKQEDLHKNELAKLADFENIRSRIVSLKNEQLELDKELCYEQNCENYRSLINDDVEESKNFLYQISKQQNLWPIRKTMQVYQKYLLSLFPCWLLSPESASQILPLQKEMFDLVIFDEASQVFIENTLPCIYRGRNIVVAGDSKQLRPTASFLKRYMGNEDIDEMDFSTQAALEVESLLDLATSRYFSSNLTYHYRSRSEELINFSNYAFYNKTLQIAPNISKNSKKTPIERIKVDGKWIDTCNTIEAKTVAELLCKLLKDKKRKGSIGIITFNIEQENAIEDEIDALSSKDKEFHDLLLVEQNRKQDGEDISLFVKNLENVQGDERDIIIFSIGYAQNQFGKVVAHFGSLSNEGGENRLNVAITRAKEKIYVVTSIEPEELNVENSKNIGPKLFKEYLKYVRSVSNENALETSIVLQNLSSAKITDSEKLNAQIVKSLKFELQNLGYKVDENLGNTEHKLPLAIYDKKSDKYLLGIEFDFSAYEVSDNILERDVYRPAFLKSRGWNIVRIWSRDYWLNKKKVLSSIQKALVNIKK